MLGKVRKSYADLGSVDDALRIDTPTWLIAAGLKEEYRWNARVVNIDGS